MAVGTLDGDQLRTLLSGFEDSWESLRTNLIFGDGRGLQRTPFARENPRQLMRAAVARRKAVVDGLLGDVLETLAREGPGDVSYVRVPRSSSRYLVRDTQVVGQWDVIAIGSSNPTSDYDVSFNFHGDCEREAQAVADFNDRFVSRFGVPAGELFDTNAYASGFMSVVDGVKLSKPRRGPSLAALRVQKTQIGLLQLVLSMYGLKEYFGTRWPEAAPVIGQEAARLVRALVDATPPPSAPPGVEDVVRVHLDKATTNTCRVDAALGARVTDKILLDLSAADVQLLAIAHSETELVDRMMSSPSVQTLRPDQRETLARDRLYAVALEVTARLVAAREADTDPLAYARATAPVVAAVGVSNIFANEAYFSEGPLFHVGPFQANEIFTRKHITQGVFMNAAYKLLHTNHERQRRLDERLAEDPIPDGLIRSWYSAAKYGARILSLVRPYENMYGQYVGKDDAVYWAAYRYLGDQGLILPLEVDEAIVDEIKKSPAGESADYDTIRSLMRVVLKSYRSVLQPIETHLLRICGVILAAGYVSKALQLSTRPEFREEEESWYAASHLSPGTDFADVMSEIGRTMPPV